MSELSLKPEMHKKIRSSKCHIATVFPRGEPALAFAAYSDVLDQLPLLSQMKPKIDLY